MDSMSDGEDKPAPVVVGVKRGPMIDGIVLEGFEMRGHAMYAKAESVRAFMDKQVELAFSLSPEELDAFSTLAQVRTELRYALGSVEDD